MKLRIICIFICLSIAGNAFAQLVGQVSVYLPGNLYPIYEDDDVAGYFWFYPNKAISATEQEYKIEVMDFAFRLTNELTIAGPIFSRLINVASNGNAFFLQFKGDSYDGPRIIVADIKGNRLVNERSGMPVPAGKIRDEVYAVKDGFLFKKGAGDDQVKFDFIDNTGKILWSLTLADANESVDWNKMEVAFFNESFVAFNDGDAKGLRIFSMQDGHEIMLLSMFHESYRLFPTTMHSNTEGIMVLGQYIAEDRANALPLKPDGIFRMVIGMDGSLLDTDFLTWQSLWRDDLPELGIHNPKLKDYVWMYQFMPVDNGILAVGEVFDAKLEEGRMAEYDVNQYVTLSLRSDFTLDSLWFMHVDSVATSSQGIPYPNKGMERFSRIGSGNTELLYSVASGDGPLFHSVFFTEARLPKGNRKQPQLEAVGLGRDGRWHRTTLDLDLFPGNTMVLPSRAGYVAYYEVYIVDQYTRYYVLKLKKFDL